MFEAKWKLQADAALLRRALRKVLQGTLALALFFAGSLLINAAQLAPQEVAESVLQQAKVDVQAQIDNVQDELAKQQTLSKHLTDALQQLKDAGKAKEAEVIYIKGSLAKAQSEFEAAQLAFLQSANMLKEQEDLYADRLVALFETQSRMPSLAEMFFSAVSIEDFLHHYEFTRLIADSDKQLIDKYQVLQDKTANDMSRAENAARQYEELLTKVEAQLSSLQQDISLQENNLLLSKQHISEQRLLQAALLKNQASYEAELKRLGEQRLNQAVSNLERAANGEALKYGSPQPAADEMENVGLDAHFAGETASGSTEPPAAAATAAEKEQEPTEATATPQPLQPENNGGLVAGQTSGYIAVQAPAARAELLALPWVFPNVYSRLVTCNFGYFDAQLYDSFPHRGVDFAADFGTKIVAALPGTVAVVNNPFEGENYAQGGSSYGNYIVIDHGNGLRTLYAHLKSAQVAVGQNVQAGELIGLAGSTGNSEGPHLHFEVQYYGELQDPYLYVGNR